VVVVSMARDEVDEDVDVGSTADEDVADVGIVDEPAVDVGDDVSAALQAPSAFASIRVTRRPVARMVLVVITSPRLGCRTLRQDP
jgi:hypothetical protein